MESLHALQLHPTEHLSRSSLRHACICDVRIARNYFPFAFRGVSDAVFQRDSNAEINALVTSKIVTLHRIRRSACIHLEINAHGFAVIAGVRAAVDAGLLSRGSGGIIFTAAICTIAVAGDPERRRNSRSYWILISRPEGSTMRRSDHAAASVLLFCESCLVYEVLARTVGSLAPPDCSHCCCESAVRGDL